MGDRGRGAREDADLPPLGSVVTRSAVAPVPAWMAELTPPSVKAFLPAASFTVTVPEPASSLIATLAGTTSG